MNKICDDKDQEECQGNVTCHSIHGVDTYWCEYHLNELIEIRANRFWENRKLYDYKSVGRKVFLEEFPKENNGKKRIF